MDHSPAPAAARSDGAVLLAYMAASSTMLLVNKLIITDFPCPFFTLACQFATSAALARASGWWHGDESLAWSGGRAAQFAPAAMAQVATIYTGIKALQYANVESFITARASAPLLISAVESAWMGHQLPCRQSAACLLGMLAGSLLYGYHDIGGDPRGYLWLGVWYLVFCFDQTYLKRVLTRLGKDCSTTGGVYYTNLLGLAAVLVGGRVEAHLVATLPSSPKPQIRGSAASSGWPSRRRPRGAKDDADPVCHHGQRLQAHHHCLQLGPLGPPLHPRSGGLLLSLLRAFLPALAAAAGDGVGGSSLVL